jgi:putative hydrolase of HD superfamily
MKLSIDNAESVADHTLAMIILTLIFAQYKNISISKTMRMIKMVLIHDVGESIIGDRTTESIEIEEKKKIENNAIRYIFSKLSNEKIKKEYLEIWKEFEDNRTDISKKVHLIDKLEMAIQAKYYLDNYSRISKRDVKPFFDSALRYVINNNKKNIKDSYIVKEIEKLDEIEQILLYLNK